MLYVLPSSFLWDISPDRSYGAIALYERALISPYVDNEEEELTLYVVSQADDCAYRVTQDGMLPSFSPDGKFLSYLAATSSADDTPVICLYDCQTQEKRVVEGTLGAATVFWIDDSTLGFTRESGEDTYAILKVSLPTGQVEILIGGS